MRPITEPLAVSKDDGSRRSYLLPNAICATCGRTTAHSHHWDCLRDKGRLMVEDGTYERR